MLAAEIPLGVAPVLASFPANHAAQAVDRDFRGRREESGIM
jgi:hypothetical protein